MICSPSTVVTWLIKFSNQILISILRRSNAAPTSGTLFAFSSENQISVLSSPSAWCVQQVSWKRCTLRLGAKVNTLFKRISSNLALSYENTYSNASGLSKFLAKILIWTCLFQSVLNEHCSLNTLEKLIASLRRFVFYKKNGNQIKSSKLDSK